MSEWFQIKCIDMNEDAAAPWFGAGAEVIAAFLNEIERDIPAEFGYHLTPYEAWPLTPEQRRELAARKGKRARKRAGYVTLKSTYGEDVAKSIISRNRR